MFIRKKTKAKIKYSLFLSAILVVVVLIAFYINGSRKHGMIIAEINDKSIYLQDVADKISFSLNEHIDESSVSLIPKEILEAILIDSYVRDEIYEKALEEDLDEDEQIKKMLVQYKKQLLVDKYLDEISKKTVSDEKVLEKYNELASLLSQKEERKIKHILVDNEVDAKRVIRDIKRAGSFEKIAEKKSLDKATASKGGEIGYVLQEQLDPEFASIAFILEEGMLSKPVQTKYGWHVIKVDDIRQAKPADFEDAKEEIRKSLVEKTQQDIIQNISKNLKVNILIETSQNYDDNNQEDIVLKNEQLIDENALEDKIEGSILGDDIVNEPSYVDDNIRRELEQEQNDTSKNQTEQKKPSENQKPIEKKIKKETKNKVQKTIESKKSTSDVKEEVKEVQIEETVESEESVEEETEGEETEKEKVEEEKVEEKPIKRGFFSRRAKKEDVESSDEKIEDEIEEDSLKDKESEINKEIDKASDLINKEDVESMDAEEIEIPTN